MKRRIRQLVKTGKIICIYSICYYLIIALNSLSVMADHAGMTLPEVCATTPNEWNQIYETQWRTVTVNSIIEVPEAERFPVLVVRRPSGHLSPTDQKQYTQYTILKDGSIERVRKGAEVVFKVNEWVVNVEDVPSDHWDLTLPDNSDISLWEATEVILSETERICEVDLSNLRLTRVCLRSRYYSKTDMKPQTTSGTWIVTWEQLFHGIAYDRAADCYGHQRAGEMMELDGQLSAQYTSSENYVIHFRLMEEIREETTDLLLYDWESAKTAFEKEILAGHLRTVDEVKLCYIPYEDPKETGLYWLLPAWVCRGIYVEDPSKEPSVWIDEETGEEYFVANSKSVVFQANLGETIKYSDQNKNRRKCPRIIR